MLWRRSRSIVSAVRRIVWIRAVQGSGDPRSGMSSRRIRTRSRIARVRPEPARELRCQAHRLCRLPPRSTIVSVASSGCDARYARTERPRRVCLALAFAQTQRCGSTASLQARDDRIPGGRSSRRGPTGDAYGDIPLVEAGPSGTREVEHAELVGRMRATHQVQRQGSRGRVWLGSSVLGARGRPGRSRCCRSRARRPR
jgi:hypothetical protein